MEIDFLKEFIATAEICNLFETSEQLFISQSTLSRHIKSLEDSLGVQLFDRTPKSLKINRNGRLFLGYARQIVAIEEEGRRALEREQEKYRDIINISTINSLCNYHINEVLTRFKTDFSQYQVNVYEADSVYNLERKNQS